MVYTTLRDDRVEKALAITQLLEVPLMVDYAAGIPPIENLSHFAELGVDLYCFSGGTGLCGPMKVGKEEIMDILAVVEEWSHTDLAALSRQWNKRFERIAKLVETVPGVTTEIEIPEGATAIRPLRRSGMMLSLALR